MNFRRFILIAYYSRGSRLIGAVQKAEENRCWAEGGHDLPSLTEQQCRSSNQFPVSRSLTTIGEDGSVLQTGTNAMTAPYSTSIDCPRGDAIAMMNLFELHAPSCEFPLNRFGVGDRIVGLGIEWLNHRTHAAWRDSRLTKRASIGE